MQDKRFSHLPSPASPLLPLMRPLDLQVNGYAGTDFNRDDLTAEALRHACVALREDGCDAILATFITDTVPNLEHRMRRLVELREQDPLAREVIAGIHIEGPFINPEKGYVGAHPPQCVKPANLEDTKARLQAMGSRNTRLLTQIEEYQRTLEQFRGTVERQQAEILALRAEVDTVRAENVRLASDKAALTDTVIEMTTQTNTAYYVVGTKDELIQRGIIAEEGGSRVLFVFGKRGKTLVPTRNLDPSMFTRIDRLQDSTIPLPRADRGYQIVTPQSLAYVTGTKLESGRIADSFFVTYPEEFWKPSRYLILVEGEKD